jgi:hypothetical protein
MFPSPLAKRWQKKEAPLPSIEHLPLGDLKPWPRNARSHSRRQVMQLAHSIKHFGFTQPVLIDEDNRILAGHGRVKAATQLGHADVPCIRVMHLSQAQKRAYVLADNKLALNSRWDRKVLAEELGDLLVIDDISFDIDVTGFSPSERDKLTASSVRIEADPPDDGTARIAARCRPGDIFELGRHRLICSDRLPGSTIGHLMGDGQPRMLIAVPCDPDSGMPLAELGPEWGEAALVNAEKSGGFVFVSEGDPRRCDRIIHNWETRTGDLALRFDGEPPGETDDDDDDHANGNETQEESA